METVFTLHRGGSDNPEYLFAFVVSDEDRPLTYAETLCRLRALLLRRGGLPTEQVSQYILHSMRVTLLSCFRQLGFSLEARHLQGLHTFAQSSTLYGRDDISPLLLTQDQFIERVRHGWRARAPLLRGVKFMPCETTFMVAPVDKLQSVSPVILHFFNLAVAGTGTATSRDSVPLHPVATSAEISLKASRFQVDDGVKQLTETAEVETSSSDALGTPDEVGFLVAETSCILHASLHGKLACGSRGSFRGIITPPNWSSLVWSSGLCVHF